MTAAASALTERHLDLLACPACQGVLRADDGHLRCAAGGHAFPVEEGIPLLYWPTEWDPTKPDVTEQVRAFYEETPFPNYDDFDDVGSLMAKARQGIFARLLDEQIPFGTRVLEVGCGTGQMSNFLSVANRTVFGADLCLNSLRLGQQFKERNDLGRAHFLQMNLFRPGFRPGSFDLVLSNGVLHHTADPFLAFRTIGTLVRPGGYLLVGLYHRYGRLITDTRRLLLRLFGERLAFLDPNLRQAHTSAAKRRAWLMDQYRHPHESKHTIGEVLGWLRQTGFDFVKSIPRSTPFEPFSEQERLFEPERPGSALERALVELPMALTGSRQGGFFIVIARRRPDGASPSASTR
ncbi:MAG TPA: methyltransferase domain-containing protein [Gemmatimonadales bacterium]|nr:methyltransferase domain-containing protein [Gemmatimonadales bacterium]